MSHSRLPRLLLIADRFTWPDVSVRVVEAVRSGVTWVQLRDHAAPGDVFEYRSEMLVKQLKSVNEFVTISINSRLDTARVQELPFHTGFHGPSLEFARQELGHEHLIGQSIHSRFEAGDAVRDGASYVIFSPVWETTSHPGKPGWGTDLLTSVCGAAGEVPVLALGGVTPDRVGACLAAGAHGVAVHWGILGAESVSKAVLSYRTALGGAHA